MAEKKSLFTNAPTSIPSAPIDPAAIAPFVPVLDDVAARRARIVDVVIRVATELALGDRRRDNAGFAHAGAEAQVALVGALITLARASRDPNAAVRRALEIIASADLTPIASEDASPNKGSGGSAAK